MTHNWFYNDLQKLREKLTLKQITPEEYNVKLKALNEELDDYDYDRRIDFLNNQGDEY